MLSAPYMALSHINPLLPTADPPTVPARTLTETMLVVGKTAVQDEHTRSCDSPWKTLIKPQPRNIYIATITLDKQNISFEVRRVQLSFPGDPAGATAVRAVSRGWRALTTILMFGRKSASY